MWKRTMAPGAVGLAMACAGCASYAPPEGVPTALITTARGPNAAEHGVAISYASPDFRETQLFQGYDFYTYDVEAPIQAETRAYIEVTGHRSAMYSETYCDSYFSFVPLQGERYVVRNEMISRGCRSWVLDPSGRLPPSFRLENGPPQS